MSSIYTLNNLINLFESIATAHHEIKFFGFGELWEIDGKPKSMREFPVLWVFPTGATQEENTTVFNFDIYVFDLVDKAEVSENYRLSDTMQILQDVLRIIRDNSDDYELVDNTATLQPFTEKFNDQCTGWFASDGIRINYDPTDCYIPSSPVNNPL